jgi:hypothetical protein
MSAGISYVNDPWRRPPHCGQASTTAEHPKIREILGYFGIFRTIAAHGDHNNQPPALCLLWNCATGRSVGLSGL